FDYPFVVKMVKKPNLTLIINRIPPSKATDHEPGLEIQTNEPSPPLPEKSSSEDYDPHDYGKQHNPTIFWGPVLHLLKYIIGAGVLTLPYFFKTVGWAVAIFGALLVGVMYTHVLHVLLDVEYQLCKKLKTPSLTFVGIVVHSFEQGPRYVRRFRTCCQIHVYFTTFFNKSLMNALYLITISSNFKIIIHHYYGTDLKLVTIMTVLLVPLIGLALIRELKFLVPLSMITNICNILSLGLILFIPHGFTGSGDLKAINDVSQFPNFSQFFSDRWK
ncbi:hypothetical protein U1Q18_051997, partial [Sarracenia purpurea var. burkii]